MNHIMVKGEKLALCMAYNSRPNGCIVSSFINAVLPVRMAVRVAANRGSGGIRGGSAGHAPVFSIQRGGP